MAEFQRSGHKMRPNHANSLPRYIVALGCETKMVPLPNNPHKWHKRFRLAIAISTRYARGKTTMRRTFKTKQPADFWPWLYKQTKSNYTTWLVGHNILWHIKELGFATEMAESRLVLDAPRKSRAKIGRPEDDAHASGICCIEAPPTIIGLRSTETMGRIIVVDLMNWFPDRLDKVAAELGRAVAHEPAKSADDLCWADYCLSGVETCLDTFVQLMEWVKDNDLGMFRYTAAAQAMSAYRHRFIPSPIYMHDNPAVKKLERAGCFGGRTDCWRIGKIIESVYKVDVNSLFPSVMREIPVPYILRRYELSDTPTTELPDIRWQDSMAEVLIRSADAIYPLRKYDCIVYPTGAFWTVLCGNELLLASTRREIQSIRNWAEYDCGVLFRDYVNELWQLRKVYKQNGNRIYDAFAKRMLNALYGKFAQRAPIWETVHAMESPGPWTTWPIHDCATGTTQRYRSFGYTVQRESGKKEIASSFVAISAFITSAARCRMNALRKIAGGETVLYQGVDSLIVTEAGLDRLRHAEEILPNTIGKLRIDGASNYGHIYGCNDYQLGDTIVVSGRSGSYETISDTLFMQRKFSATADLFDGRLSPDVSETKQFWQRRRSYAKGIVSKSGEVSPLAVDQPDCPLDWTANAESTAN